MSKLSLFLSCTALITMAACSSSPSTTPDAKVTPTIDAATPAIDAPTAALSATEVDCTTAPTAPVVANAGLSYSPGNTAVVAGGVVKFMLGATHDVASTISGLIVPLGGTKCLKFATAGVYNFHCTPHGFTGTITVTAALN